MNVLRRGAAKTGDGDSVMALIAKNGGTITSAQVTAMGLQRRALSELCGDGRIYRAARGIYALPETWEDEMYFLQYRFSKGVFSHETALYMRGLSDRTPQAYTMTFPRGYGAHGLKKAGVSAKFTSLENYGLGIAEMPSPCGNAIRVYNAERTLCDIVKGGNSCDIQLVNHAMKVYAGSPQKDMAKLFGYAELLRVKPKILRYMEVLL